MGITKSKNYYEENVTGIIDNLELQSPNENLMLKHRFLYEVLYYEKKRNNTKKYYNFFRFIVTLGSIFLPAILSIGQMDPNKLPKHFNDITYWLSWGISLSVTTCNGFLQLFALDKNYFLYSIVVEQLKTEGWQFFQLSGKYEDYESHIECYKLFCKTIESIKRKQVEQQFTGGKADKKKKFSPKKTNLLENNIPEINLNKSIEKINSTQNTNIIDKEINLLENNDNLIKNNIQSSFENITKPIVKATNDLTENIIDSTKISENKPPKKNEDLNNLL